MSAFVVSQSHLDAIISNAGKFTNRISLPEGILELPNDADEIGQILLDENVRSVNYRYKENEPAPEYHWKPSTHNLGPVELLKVIGCLEYQSCECPDYPVTLAAVALAAIKAACISAIIKADTKLKTAYSKAPWTIDGY